MHRGLRFIHVLLLSVLLTCCGFHLRGDSQFNHESAWVAGQTRITAALVKALKNNDVQVVTDKNAASMQVELTKEDFEKRILSVGGTGQVTEYELYYRVYYRTKTPENPQWSDIQTLETRRFFSYSNASLLAKQSEEKLLNESMQKDVLNALVRRLSTLR